jgi:hypothetical protein
MRLLMPFPPAPRPRLRLRLAKRVDENAFEKPPVPVIRNAILHALHMRRGVAQELVSTTKVLAHAASTCRSTITGSVKAKVEPWPGCDSTQILPPCISMMRFDMASPNPVPPFLRVIALSAC